MYHNSILQSHPHWGSLLVSPHKIRPPDSLYLGLYSFSGIWLSLISIWIFICPLVGSDVNDFTLNYAEFVLSHNSEFPRKLEGFELGFVSRYKPISIVYDVLPNNDSWIFITPCSNSNYTITIQSLTDNRELREPNKTHSFNEKPFDQWYMKVRNIDMKLSSGLGEKINISNWKRQQLHVRNLNLGVMRLHIDRSHYFPDVYMIRQYSGLIDAFYPRIPPNPVVRICLSDSSKSSLKIFVSRAFNADMYCASFNLEENLPNICSAQLKIEKRWLNKQRDYKNLKIRRPSIFDDYFKNKNKSPIKKAEFHCFKTNRFEVALDRSYRQLKMYINIYAINNGTKFSDSYAPVEYHWDQYENICKGSSKTIVVNRNNPQRWIMGNETIFFNISTEDYGKNPSKLLYQSCIHSQEQSLHIFRQESQTPLCVEIVHNRLTALCTSLKPGIYRLQHTLNIKPLHSMPVGQLYFLPDNIALFPHIECNRSADFSIRLHQAALDDSKSLYKLNISFNRVPSHFAISYYFHIIDFQIPNDTKLKQFEFISQIETKLKAERNFCKFIHKQDEITRPVHTETLQGLGCSDSVKRKEYTLIPGIFNGNNTYAVLVYFSRASDWKRDYIQFYSNRIFTMSSEEDVF